MPDLKYQPGFYAGTVQEFMLDVDNDDDAQPVLCFKVKMDDYDTPVWCYHKAYGKGQDGTPREDKAKAVLEYLGGSYESLDEFNPDGKRVTVSIMHNEFKGRTYENGYIALGGKRKSSDSTRTAAMSRLTGKLAEDGLPFK